MSLPDTNMDLLKEISDKRGRTMNEKAGSLDKGMKDIEKGRLHTAKNADDLINQILG